jgi:CheY-like chemotaxis protein
MKTIIIEDEYPAAERLGQLLGKLDTPVEVIAVLESVSGAVQWLTANPAPDLIFSDIQLSDGLSFQIFDAVPVNSPIVFTTSYDEYAIKAFKVKSIDYLLKPIKLPELQGAVHKYHQMQPSARAGDYALRIESLLDSLPVPGKKYKNRFLVNSRNSCCPSGGKRLPTFLRATAWCASCATTAGSSSWITRWRSWNTCWSRSTFSGSTGNSSPRCGPSPRFTRTSTASSSSNSSPAWPGKYS